MGINAEYMGIDTRQHAEVPDQPYDRRRRWRLERQVPRIPRLERRLGDRSLQARQRLPMLQRRRQARTQGRLHLLHRTWRRNDHATFDCESFKWSMRMSKNG